MTPLRKNDVCLMNVAREMELTPTQLERVNCVQMWFNVQYLSELCEEDGKAIRHGIIDGSHFQRLYVQKSDGPNQKRPNNRSWLFWIKLINMFIKPGTDIVPKHRLGKWTKDHSKHGRWPIYAHENKVYEFRINEMNEENGQYTTNMAHNYGLRMNWTMMNSIIPSPLQQKFN